MRQKDSVNGTIRGRLPDGTPNPVDIYVGQRVKTARLKRGLSQTQLAAAMNVTFQTIQKYEKGDTRIGASRLWDLSQILNEPIDYFYEGIDKDIASPRMNDNFSENEDSFFRVADLILTPEDLELIRNYKRIRNKATAQSIVELAKALSLNEPKKNVPIYEDMRDDGCPAEIKDDF